MSGLSFEQLRIPLLIALLVVVGFVLWPRGDDDEPAGMSASPEPTIVVGQPGGEVIPAETPVASSPATLTPTPTASPEPTASDTAEPTAPPVVADGFTAEVLACRSISGATCNNQLGTLPPSAATFVALVRFTDATVGDTINAVINGPSGTIPGGAYSLQGSGDGYYYTTFQAGGLPAGDYTLTATRNGDEVAVTSFTRAGS
jgi:hypothetical protein